MADFNPTPSVADRNLLFGVLALQLDFINRDQLVAAMNAWVLDKVKPLGQVLVEQGALTKLRLGLIDPLVDEHVLQHGGDPQRSLAALTSVSEIRPALASIGDSDIRASIDLLKVSGLGESLGTLPQQQRPAPLPGLRFRVLRPHARGGLGEVFVAEDLELHREVALKEIKNQHADQPASRDRFILEAEITGGLEHPSIVPVYSLGNYADGRPFYAMRFIKGDSLSEAIRRFHACETNWRDPTERSLALRGLLRRLVDACNAIAYAHSRGVLHRDLKPSNIMLGNYGETLVIDWGLAKATGVGIDTQSPANGLDAPRPASGSEYPLRPTSGLNVDRTRIGSAIGTPGYMSPEQAAGRLDKLGPATDVYSLGATLFQILSARPPFEGGDVEELLRKVQRGEFALPRQLKPRVSAALEAICLKAMAFDPAHRYPTPQAFAEDIEHWLADESVLAYREPIAARAGRWLRRHRTLAATVATLFLAAFVSSVSLVILIGNTNVLINKALYKAQEELRRAQIERDKYSWMAEVLDVTEDPIALEGCFSRVPASIGSQITILEVLDRGTRKSTKRLSDRPEIQAAVLEATGNAYRSLGFYEEARSRLTEALRLRQENTGVDQEDVASSLQSLGALYHEWGRFEDGHYDNAAKYYAAALDIWERHWEHDGLPYFQTRFHQAWLKMEEEDFDGAELLLREVIDRTPTGSVAAERLVLRARMGLVAIKAAKGKEHHLSVVLSALGPLQDLLKLEKDEKLNEAANHLGIAVPASKLGSTFIATNNFRRCLELIDKALGPRNYYSPFIIFMTADALANAKKRDEAELKYVEGWDRVGKSTGFHHHLLPRVASAYAKLMYEIGKRAEAHAKFDQILNAQEQLFGKRHYFVANSLVEYAQVLGELNEPSRQERASRSALEIFEQAGGPRHSRFSDCLGNLASALEAQARCDGLMVSPVWQGPYLSTYLLLDAKSRIKEATLLRQKMIQSRGSGT